MSQENKKPLRKLRKIGLLGPFGHGNLGDAAIQQAMLQNLRRYHPDAQVLGFSLYPDDTQRRHDIESHPLGRISVGGWDDAQAGKSKRGRLLRRLYSIYYHRRGQSSLVRRLIALPIEIVGVAYASTHLIGMDRMIISGGGQLDDYWGGAFHHPYTLLLSGLLARLRRVPYLFVSQGAAPLNSIFARFFDRWALALASYRSFRDAWSRDFIKKIGFFRNDPVYPDLAFSLDVSGYQPNPAYRKGFKGVVGIGPMMYFDPRVWPEKDPQIYGSYLSKLATVAAWLIEQNFAILLYTGEAIHDRPVINDLRNLLNRCGVLIAPGQIIEEPIDTVDQLMNQLASVDVVIASRFHGVLLPLLLKKPVLALSYHPKVASLMEDTGLAQYCVSIDDFQIEQVIRLFQDLQANHTQVVEKITERVACFRAALDEQYERLYGNS